MISNQYRLDWLSAGILFLLLVSGTSSFATEVRNCHGMWQSSSQFQYQFGQRHFSFIGWSHNVNSTYAHFVEALNGMVDAVNTRDCDRAERVMHEYLSIHAVEPWQEFERVYGALQLIFDKFPVNGIGQEFTLAEYSAQQAYIRKTERTLKSVKRVCSTLNVEKMRKIFAGPEYEFALAHLGEIKVKAMEDDKVKTEALGKIPQEAFDYDPQTSGFSAPTIAAIDELNGDPSDLEEEKLLALESNPTLKAKIKRLYGARKIAFESMILRNRAILKNIIRDNDDYAVVIGSDHLGDIYSQLDSMCRFGAR